MQTCEVYLCIIEYMNMFICADTYEGQKFIPGYLPQLLFDPGSLTGPGVLDFGWAG